MWDRMTDGSAGGGLGDLETGRRLFNAVFEHTAEIGAAPRDWPVIEGYHLLRKVSSGGGGDVYYAVRRGADAPCAVKVIRRTAAQDQTARRAWRELDVLQQLNLPFVPRLYDYGVHDGNLYFAAEFIEGLPLDEYCRAQQVDLRGRVRLLRTLAEQVQQLHERGVLHRDLKPGNIIVDLYGRTHIIDFGIAHLIDADEATITEPGAVVGSPAFMAPEQARGERTRVSTRTDVYALGAIAFLLLTGEPPHPRTLSRNDLLRRVATEPCRKPLQVKPSLPKPLAAIIARATAFEPGQRFASTQELADDLQRWQEGRPVEVMRLNPTHVAWMAAKRRPVTTVVGVAGVLVVLLTVFFAALLVSGAQQRKAEAEAHDQRQKQAIFTGIIAAEKARHDEDFVLALQLMNVFNAVEGDGTPYPRFTEAVAQHRNELSMAVLKSTYGEEQVNRVNRNGAVDAMLARLAARD